MTQTPTIKIGTYLFPQQFTGLEKALKIHPPLPAEVIQDFRAACEFTSIGPASIFIISARSRDDLIAIANIAKEIRKGSATVRIVVMSERNLNIQKFASKLGILDVIDYDTPMKSLRYKINFWLKAMSAQEKRSSYNNEKSFREKEKKQELSDERQHKSAVFVPALECENDIWLLKSKEHCKFIFNKWILKLMGPSPFVGRWMEAGKGTWTFKFKDEENPFCSKDGSWLVKATAKPEFVWKENLWLFTGDQYELFYKSETEKIVRVSVRNKEMTISENSEYAKFKQKAIIDSFDSALVMEGERAISDREKVEQDGTERFENLSGKGKTSNYKHKPLSGEVDGTDNMDHGPLSGTSKTDQISTPPLSLALKDQSISQGELLGDLGPAEDFGGRYEDKTHATEHLSSYYGKASKQEAMDELDEDIDVEVDDSHDDLLTEVDEDHSLSLSLENETQEDHESDLWMDEEDFLRNQGDEMEDPFQGTDLSSPQVRKFKRPQTAEPGTKTEEGREEIATRKKLAQSSKETEKVSKEPQRYSSEVSTEIDPSDELDIQTIDDDMVEVEEAIDELMAESAEGSALKLIDTNSDKTRKEQGPELVSTSSQTSTRLGSLFRKAAQQYKKEA